MARKKQPEAHANHERWLVSYADFITLLFAFFVVMFATAQTPDAKKVKQFEDSFSAAISGTTMWPEPGGLGAGVSPAGGHDIVFVGVSDAYEEGLTKREEDGDSLDDGFFESLRKAEPQQEEPPVPEGPEPNPGLGAMGSPVMEEVYKDLKDVLAKEIDIGQINMRQEKRGIVISLGEAGFFDSGASFLKPKSIETVDVLAGKLRNLLQNRDIMIRIEGHTDDVPLSTPGAKGYRDNQELSTARANTVVRRLRVTHGFPPKNLVASGYGEYHPVASNATEEGRARNRRVDIVLLSDEFAAQEPPSDPA
ncbi:OmpA family protein [bacterium]|nr:OmpA family protein [bacterium]